MAVHGEKPMAIDMSSWRSRQQVFLVDHGSFRMGESSSRQRQIADSMPARYIITMKRLLSSAFGL